MVYDVTDIQHLVLSELVSRLVGGKAYIHQWGLGALPSVSGVRSL